MTTLHVRNWEKHQHYKSGRGQPPWVKLHRKLLDDMVWHQLSTVSKAFLPQFWLLASENEGGWFKDDAKEICFRLRSMTLEEVETAIEELVASGLLARCYQDASKTGQNASTVLAKPKPTETKRKSDLLANASNVLALARPEEEEEEEERKRRGEEEKIPNLPSLFSEWRWTSIPGVKIEQQWAALRASGSLHPALIEEVREYCVSADKRRASYFLKAIQGRISDGWKPPDTPLASHLDDDTREYQRAREELSRRGVDPPTRREWNEHFKNLSIDETEQRLREVG